MYRKKSILFALILGLLLFFCGCTAPQKLDILEFCKEFNAIAHEELLVSRSFFETKENESVFLHSTALSSASRPLLCSMQAEKSGAVCSWQLTLLQPKASPAQEALCKDCLTYFIFGAAVLTRTSPDRIEKELASIGFSEKEMVFSPAQIQKEQGKWRFTFLSRKEGLSLVLEAIEL